MRRTATLSTIGLVSVIVQLMAAGCTSPAPNRVSVPPRDTARDYGRGYEHEPMKPLPGEAEHAERSTNLPRPYDDAPLMTQRPPEQKAFVEAYDRVGRPRLLIMAVPADRSSDSGGVDYAAIETVLADWLSANGQVTLVSASTLAPTTGPANPGATQDADVLVRVQVNQMTVGKDVQQARLITEAVNTRGGESIGRAVVDVPAPLVHGQLNEATRFIARKLMDEMTESWNRLAAGPRPAAAMQSAPSPPPSPSPTETRPIAPTPPPPQPATQP